MSTVAMTLIAGLHWFADDPEPMLLTLAGDRAVFSRLGEAQCYDKYAGGVPCDLDEVLVPSDPTASIPQPVTPITALPPIVQPTPITKPPSVVFPPTCCIGPEGPEPESPSPVNSPASIWLILTAILAAALVRWQK